MLIEELDEEPTDRSYTFHHLPDAKFSSFGSPEIQPFFDKWGFGPDMAMCTFRVEQKVTSETFQTMLDAFFKDREVLSVLLANRHPGAEPAEGECQMAAHEYEGCQHVVLQQAGGSWMYR